MLDAEADDGEDQRTQAESTEGVEQPGRADPVPATTRRRFVQDVGKKALYITPVVLTLTAAEALGAPGSGNCYQLGSPCTAASDCCEFEGEPLDCDDSVCCLGFMQPCMSDAECCGINVCAGTPQKCTMI